MPTLKTSSPTLKRQYFTDAGLPAANHWLYTYQAGSVIPLATYTDKDGGTPNANPVVLDSAGRCNIWFSPQAYKLVLKTSAGAEVWTQDNQVDPGQLETDQLADASNVAYGDALVAYKHIDGISALTARTVHARWQDQPIDIVDYGADPTGVADSTAAIQLAITNLPTRGGLKYGRIYCPTGDYKVTGQISFESCRGVQFFGNGPATTRFLVDTGGAFNLFRIFGTRDCYFGNFAVVCSAADPLTAVFLLETKSGATQTNNVFERIDIEATDAGGMTYGFRGITGTGGDNNNDAMTFYNVAIRKGVRAVSVEHRQAKSWRFFNCEFFGLQGTSEYGVYGSNGSMMLYSCQMVAYNTAAVYANDQNDPGVVLIGNGVEDSARLFAAGNTPSGANFSVVLIGNRFAANPTYMHADNRPVLYYFKGPLLVMGNTFGGNSGGVDPLEFPVFANQNNAQDLGRSSYIGNQIESTLDDPFVNSTGNGPTTQLDNTNKISTVAAVAGLPNTIRSLSVLQMQTGSQVTSVVPANDLDVGPRMFALLEGTGTVNGVLIPPQPAPYKAQMIQFKQLTGVSTMKHNTAPSAGYAVLKLFGETDFIMVAGDTLTIRYDPNQGFWHEVGRSQTEWGTPMGTSISRAYTGGRANVNTTAVGNVGGGEDDLITYALPANSLDATNRGIRITAYGTAANTAAAKVLRLYFGATVLVSLSLTANQLGYWRATAELFRTGAATQDAIGQIVQGGATTLVAALHSTPGETLSGAVTVKCTGEATNNNDIVQEGLLVEWIR